LPYVVYMPEAGIVIVTFIYMALSQHIGEEVTGRRVSGYERYI